MTRKRRMFDIEIPHEQPESGPSAKGEPAEVRRGPMATAIAETAESSRERSRLEAEIRAENDALALEHVRLKRAGLITDLVDVDRIDTHKLARDRAQGEDQEMTELIQSIREIGLSNPIQVEPAADGRFELIQGWRRLSAYRALLKETGDAEKWGRIPAGIAVRGDALEQLYRRMVDENMVRKDISFAEMAQLALHYAADPLTQESDAEKAVAVLFRSAGYQKRSYIRGFIRLMGALGGHLEHAPHIPRALGLTLAQKIDEMPQVAQAIRSEFDGWAGRSAAEELDVLRRFAGQAALVEKPSDASVAAAAPTAKARTSFQIQRPQGSAKCTAANGRLEIRLPRDFSAIDRRKLESAVRAMLESLE